MIYTFAEPEPRFRIRSPSRHHLESIARGVNPYNTDYDERQARDYVKDDRNARPDQGAKPNHASKIDYGIFMEMFSGSGIDIGNASADTAAKRIILRKAGYHGLRVGGGHVSIENASPGRIGIVFKKTRDAAARRGF